jgi:hypothetical protein
LIFLISSSFFLLSNSSHMAYSNLKLQPKIKICITVTTFAYSHLQMTSMYTGFLDLDMMIMKKMFKGQESLSSQPCLVCTTLENILLKMFIYEITYLETFTLVYNHIFTKTYKWQTILPWEANDLQKHRFNMLLINLCIKYYYWITSINLELLW